MITLDKNPSENLTQFARVRKALSLTGNISYLTTALFLPVLMLLSTPSSAELGLTTATSKADGKTFPGSMCLPKQGDKTATTTTGVLYNTSGHDQIWTCPIVRDVMKGQKNGITTAVVKFIDNHTRRSVSCTLKSMSFHGGAVVQQTDDSADGTITFQGLKSFTNGYYVLRCKVPAMQGVNRRSGIRVYRINEKL